MSLTSCVLHIFYFQELALCPGTGWVSALQTLLHHISKEIGGDLQIYPILKDENDKYSFFLFPQVEYVQTGQAFQPFSPISNCNGKPVTKQGMLPKVAIPLPLSQDCMTMALATGLYVSGPTSMSRAIIQFLHCSYLLTLSLVP